ncbi:MAG: hypothetical protein LUO99_02215 [Methanomicrobiales archaeon]|nr:hypothetical protein [Methanomicrobiales archaeon]
MLLLAFILACGCMLPGEDTLCVPAPDPSLPVPEKSPPDTTLVIPQVMVPVTVSLPPASTPVGGPETEPPILRNFTFLSGKKTYHISVTVDPPAAGTMNATGEHCPMEQWRAGNEGLVSAYYLGRFTAASEQEMYTSLLAELSRIRRMEGLNDDEYLELITNFIQQIPYDPEAPLCPRTPTDVIRDGSGDCDEKSGLLLGLLSREGYDVALLLFPDLHHATAGVRISSATTPSFRTFGPPGKYYVYVEPTRPTLVGLYDAAFASAPVVVVPAGNGTTGYRAINDVMYVVGVQKRMEEKMTYLLDTRETHLQEILRLENRLSDGDYETYDEYSADSSRYSRLIDEYNQMGKDFIAIQDVHQFLLEHQYDRAGCRARIEITKVEVFL